MAAAQDRDRKIAGLRHRQRQYEEMSAQCFSALGLAMKMQLGEAAQQLSITSLYNEAAEQKVRRAGGKAYVRFWSQWLFSDSR